MAIAMLALGKTNVDARRLFERYRQDGEEALFENRSVRGKAPASSLSFGGRSERDEICCIGLSGARGSPLPASEAS